jgi:patatin-like phospholipase/acyl hydrolase
MNTDGGGVRGLAAIEVLEHLMDAANRERRAKNLSPQEPWEMFDMIAGVDTGGQVGYS